MALFNGISYDNLADSFFLSIKDGTEKTKEFNLGPVSVLTDKDSRGNLTGIEVLNVKGAAQEMERKITEPIRKMAKSFESFAK